MYMLCVDVDVYVPSLCVNTCVCADVCVCICVCTDVCGVYMWIAPTECRARVGTDVYICIVSVKREDRMCV